MSRAILVTGATGNQGGAVIRALLAQNANFQILAVTRNAASVSAQKLAAKSPRITLVQGNLDDVDSLFRAAKQATKLPLWGVFSMQVQFILCLRHHNFQAYSLLTFDPWQLPPFSKDGPTVEMRQGKALIDASITNGVGHFVYASVDRNGAQSDFNPTNVPHFRSKHYIEKHLLERSQTSAMSWTILRPAAFMENFDGGFIGKVTATSWKLVVKSRPLQLVAVDDIGWFVANAFMEPGWSAGKCISLAGDELTWEEAAKVFREATGKEIPMTWGFVARIILWMSEPLGTMYAFFEKEGYGADVEELKKVHPGLLSLKAWLEGKKAKKQQ